MQRLAFIVLALFLLSACGTSQGWVNKNLSDQHHRIDLNNCEWEATHKDNGDGTHTVIDPSDQEFDASVAACMKAKGYTWGDLD